MRTRIARFRGFAIYRLGVVRINPCLGRQALCLDASNYERILHFFHSDAVKADKLSRLWLTAVLTFFPVLQYLSMTCEKDVWKNYGSWIRTIRPNVLPSESVVSESLKNTLPDFLAFSTTGGIIEKFIASKIDRERPDSKRYVA